MERPNDQTAGQEQGQGGEPEGAVRMDVGGWLSGPCLRPEAMAGFELPPVPGLPAAGADGAPGAQ